MDPGVPQTLLTNERWQTGRRATAIPGRLIVQVNRGCMCLRCSVSGIRTMAGAECCIGPGLQSGRWEVPMSFFEPPPDSLAKNSANLSALITCSIHGFRFPPWLEPARWPHHATPHIVLLTRFSHSVSPPPIQSFAAKSHPGVSSFDC